MKTTVKGERLQVGDLVYVWWRTPNNRPIGITHMHIYTGPFDGVEWPVGSARIALFADGKAMTIVPQQDFEIEITDLVFVMMTQGYPGDAYGEQFSFTAQDHTEAEAIRFNWTRYHSFDNDSVRIEETDDPRYLAWIRNEYIDSHRPKR